MRSLVTPRAAHHFRELGGISGGEEESEFSMNQVFLLTQKTLAFLRFDEVVQMRKGGAQRGTYLPDPLEEPQGQDRASSLGDQSAVAFTAQHPSEAYVGAGHGNRPVSPVSPSPDSWHRPRPASPGVAGLLP